MGVEPKPFHMTDSQVSTAPADAVAAAWGGAARTPGAEPPRPGHVRLGLQQRAPVNLKRHLSRAVRRFVILLIADLASFYVMRALLRAVRDDRVLGDWLAGPISTALPKGILNGWQLAAALLVGLLVTGNYGPGDQRRSPRRLFLGCALATALPLWMTLWTKGLEVVTLEYLLIVVLVWAGLLVERLLLDRAITWAAPRRNATIATLFVGPAEHCRAAVQSTVFGSGTEHRIVGFVDTHLPPAADALGHIVEFAGVMHDTACETVVMCGYLPDSSFHNIVDAALGAGCQVLSVPRAMEIAGVAPVFVRRHGERLIELTAPSLKGQDLAIKRVVDVVGATLGLVLTAPVMALIAAAIKLDSPGPVFFGQTRVGLGGQQFRMLKFRTMRQGGGRREADGCAPQSLRRSTSIQDSQ